MPVRLTTRERNPYTFPVRDRGEARDMAVLKEVLTAAEYEALDEGLKKLDIYKQAGDGSWGLQHDGVGKLRASLDAKDQTLREKDAEIDRMKRDIAKYADLDPEKARAAMARLTELEKSKLIDAKDYEAALAVERNTWESEKQTLEDKAKQDRSALEQLLIRDALRTALTSGRGPDGKPIPKVKDGLLEGAEELIRARHTPRLIEVGEARQAVAKGPNGQEMKLGDFAHAWLNSEAAKDWVVLPETVGSRDGATVTGAVEVKGTVSSTDRGRIGASLEQIASGEVVVSD